MHKKIIRKTVSVSKSEILEKHLKSKYNKFQRFVSKHILRVHLADAYEFLFRVQYKGSAKLKVNDIVVNSQGVMFAVLREENRIALIVSMGSFVKEPYIKGTITIMEKIKENKINNLNIIK